MRRRTEHGQQIGRVIGVVAKHRVGQADALRTQHLVRAQLIARRQNCLRLIGRINPHQLELLSPAKTAEIGREAILHGADAVYIEELRNTGLYDQIWQAFAVLVPVKTVGVMGDFRTYDSVCALRAVTSTDGMTADIYPFDAAFLSRVATRIINEVKGINRVVYDYTSKPPGTIEWE